MNLPLRVSIVFLLTLVLSGVPTPAYACTEPPGGLPHYTITEHVQAADVVVEGLIIKTDGKWYPEIATIQVYQYIKGNGPAVIEVRGYFPSSMCGTDVREDMHAIFYIRTDAYGSYYAMQLGQFDAVIGATPENVAEALAASGQEPVVITRPTVDAYLTVLASITPGTATSSPTTPPTEPVASTAAPPTLIPDTIVPTTLTLLLDETPPPPWTVTPLPPTATRPAAVAPAPAPVVKPEPSEPGWIGVTLLIGVIFIAAMLLRRRDKS